MKKCNICNDHFDEQFITQFETLAHNKKVLLVCFYCKEDESEYDDAEEMECIRRDGSIYYPSHLL